MTHLVSAPPGAKLADVRERRQNRTKALDIMTVTFQHLNFDILVDVFELAHVACPWSAAQLGALTGSSRRRGGQ